MITQQDLKTREELWESGYWEIPDGLDVSNFNFAWRPYKHDRPYIHQFGTQWQKTGGPKFIIPNNEGIKYQDFQHAIKLPDENNRCWRPLLPNCEMDLSWHPDDTEPPFIYVFGNQWYDSEVMPTYQYRVKGATEKKYINDVKAKLLPNKSNWKIPEDIDDSEFDYSWVPNPYEPPINWVFGTQWQKTGGPVYASHNSIGNKFVDFQKVKKLSNKNNRCWRILKSDIDFDFSWHPDDTEPPYMYVFGNQWYDAEVMPTLIYRVKNSTEKKYVKDIKSRLLPNKNNWEIPDDIDDSTFDYSWLPNPFEPIMNHQFGTQWQKTGGPKFVQKNAIDVKFENCLSVIKKPNLKQWKVLHEIQTESFDFSWHPDETEGLYNYVFGNSVHSAEHMPTLIYKMKGAQTTKYLNDIKPALKISNNNYQDSIFDAVVESKFDTTYTYYGTKFDEHAILLSDDEIPHIHIIDNTAAIIPKNAKTYLYDKLFDYPYVKHHRLGYHNKPLDIIFLSNGEKGSEENYEHLLSLVKGLPNNVIGLKNIKGRVASQHEAARNSSTPWYFLINGKCKVNPDFDFSWQPDRMTRSKHYIFRATNPVNGLEYGHMAIVANNKKLTLETTGKGLDFTLDRPHAVLNVNSGIGVFNTSKWDTWRTAFREVIKLKHNAETINDSASKERLNIWLTVANGDYAEYAIKGSQDAVNYYNEVNGDFDKLKLSYDWEWLYTKFNSYRP